MSGGHYIATVPCKVAGIPCLAGVLEREDVAGSHSYHASSDLDYNGYKVCAWDLLDRKGYLADWLRKKMTPADVAGVEQSIFSHMKD